jgi:hypothetical protein
MTELLEAMRSVGCGPGIKEDGGGTTVSWQALL